MQIDIVADLKTTLGEGPLWDVGQQRLYWIDSFDGRIFRCTADGRELRAWEVGQKIGSMALRRDGRSAWWRCGVHTLDLESGELELVVAPSPTFPATGSTTARWTGRAASSSAPWTPWRSSLRRGCTGWTRT